VLKSGSSFPTLPGVRNYVLSRTLTDVSDKSVEIVREDAAEFVRRLKAEESERVIAVTGGLLAKTLFEANLIDEVRVNVHPILLSSGVPLFHEMVRQIDLELMACKPFANGCVLVTYRVKRRSERSGDRVIG
jgi:dihydrofolate reductase